MDAFDTGDHGRSRAQTPPISVQTRAGLPAFLVRPQMCVLQERPTISDRVPPKLRMEAVAYYILRPIKQTMVSTRDWALNLARGGILRIRRTEDREQMGHLQSASACVEDTKSRWPGDFTAGYEELSEIYKSLQIGRGAAQGRVTTQFEERACQLTGALLRAFKQGNPKGRVSRDFTGKSIRDT